VRVVRLTDAAMGTDVLVVPENVATVRIDSNGYVTMRVIGDPEPVVVSERIDEVKRRL
jgi:hypothetical protein